MTCRSGSRIPHGKERRALGSATNMKDFKTNLIRKVKTSHPLLHHSIGDNMSEFFRSTFHGMSHGLGGLALRIKQCFAYIQTQLGTDFSIRKV